jgi:hypothetical protein
MKKSRKYVNGLREAVSGRRKILCTESSLKESYAS